MSGFNKIESQQKMDKTLEVLAKEFSGLRTGRASVNLLDSIVVDAYGARTPLNGVGSISVPESRMLSVQVWDANLVKSVEKAIRDSGLGLNPQTEGQLIRLPVPALSEERRKELQKVASQYAEKSRVSIRNIRREVMDDLKRQEKDKEISQDEHKKASEEVQKLTDEFIKKIDEQLKHKEEEIMQV
jgi:ribosome recycling factor